jgi:LPS-assembly protein
MEAQLLTNALPASDTHEPASAETQQQQANPSTAQKIPDDPSLQLLPVQTLPIAKPEPLAQTGVPVRWEALEQTRLGDTSTLTGQVVFYYKNYVIHADKVVYHHATSTVEAEGHLQLEGGPDDAILTASHGEMHLDDHTAAFYDVTGSFGVRHVGRAMVYSTPDPFIFEGRVLLQTGERAYRIVDGSMTSCRLPKPDWKLISRSIVVADGKASTHNSVFEFWRIPLFYLPFVARNLDETGRESGFLLPGGENSGVKGLVIGDEVYWVINRSMDLTIGAEYWSKRGFAPTGSFRYRGPGLDALAVRWDALLDRGIEETVAGATTPTLVNQGGADIVAYGRKYITPETRVAGVAEYLSNYVYRITFDENLAQATSSEVQSDIALTHTHNGFIPSVNLDRFESFSGTAADSTAPVVNVPEVRLLHLPTLRFDVADRPLLPSASSSAPTFSPVYWGLGSSIGDFDRAEPHFHARNVGRIDIYPHIELPIHLGDWNFLPTLGLRTTEYSGSQIPDLANTHFDGVPIVQHNPINRSDVEVSLDIRPPAFERDFDLSGSHRELRHVIEPEIFYRYVTGIHTAQQTLQFDTTDIATNTNEAGFSLTQRLYLRRTDAPPCSATQPDLFTFDAAHEKAPNLDPLGQEISYSSSPSNDTGSSAEGACKPPSREWASWQIAQKFYINPNFGGAIIDNRRNVFDATLDSTGIAFLTSPRNIAPILSRLRFEAIDRLRVEWDLDYDPKAGRITADNLFAGYGVGRATIGIGYSGLDAVEESNGKATTVQGQQVKPFLYFGKPSDVGLSVALNASYDFSDDQMQYEGVEAVYNWNCCGLQAGYRRFSLGTLRDEGEWLWGFTLSSIGTAGNIRRSTSVFPTPAALRLSY